MGTDDPDPDSPYFILRKSDVGMDTSTVRLDANEVDAGPPLSVGWKVPYYGKSSDRPADIYDGPSVSLVCMRAHVKPEPAAIVSAALFGRLEQLAPGALIGTPVRFVSADKSETLEYVAVEPRVALAARPISSARPGDLQWGTVAFAPDEAPAPLFSLGDGVRRYVLVDRRIGDGLRDGFRDVHLSAFHATPAEGGARPAMAALQRMMAGTGSPSDQAVVTTALRDNAAATRDATPTVRMRTAKPAVAKPARPAAKAKPKAKPAKAKPKAKPAKAKPKAANRRR